MNCFSAAAVLDLEAELSRILRYEGVRRADQLPESPLLFVNTHPAEMSEPGLLTFSLHELRELAPDCPVVLEIHEAAVTRLDQMRELRAALADMNIDLAYDDCGAGQARLVELTEVPPDYLKFDINLIRDIQHASSERRQLLASLVQMVRDLPNGQHSASAVSWLSPRDLSMPHPSNLSRRGSIPQPRAR